jgi:hypothetical protein
MSYGLRGLNGRIVGLGCWDRFGHGVSGLGDATSDYQAYEANLAQAWAQGPSAIQKFETNPANAAAVSGPPAASAQPQLMSYYDLLKQANLQSCDPRDSTCVSNNVARQAAVEDFWVKNKMTVPVGTQLTFAPQTASQVSEFYNATNPLGPSNVVDTRGVLVGAVSPAGAPAPVASPHAQSGSSSGGGVPGAGGTAPGGGGAPAGGSAPGSPTLTSTLQTSPGGFSLSSIPWWGWAAAAGVAFFAVKGAR